MSEYSDAVQSKCLAFGDRIIKLNDFLLAQAVAAHENYKKTKFQKKPSGLSDVQPSKSQPLGASGVQSSALSLQPSGTQPSAFSPQPSGTQPSSFSPQPSKTQPSSFSPQPSSSSVPVHLQSVSALCNQLLRAGTSIGANNAEACNAISRQDFRSKSYIALKEARESLYWIELLHRNNYLDNKQYESIYADCEELVKILVARCKNLDKQLMKSEG